MKLWIALLKFLLIGGLFIVSNSNLHLNVPAEREVFFDSYHSWLDNLFGHSMEIGGYVINSEWLPEEDSPDRGR